jgi:hypothetical protein
MKQCVSQCSLGRMPHDCRYATRTRQGIVHIRQKHGPKGLQAIAAPRVPAMREQAVTLMAAGASLGPAVRTDWLLVRLAPCLRCLISNSMHMHLQGSEHERLSPVSQCPSVTPPIWYDTAGPDTAECVACDANDTALSCFIQSRLPKVEPLAGWHTTLTVTGHQVTGKGGTSASSLQPLLQCSYQSSTVCSSACRCCKLLDSSHSGGKLLHACL